MALINRMARLFTADLHAVLDRIEEPEVLLRQAVREMEEAVKAAEQRLAALEHEHTSLNARRQQTEAVLSELAEQLDVCFGSDSEDLARKLIRRRLETERSALQLTQRLDANDRAVAEARADLAEYREQLEHVRQKAELFDDRGDDATRHDGAFDLKGDDRSVGDDEVEVAFLREKQRRARS